LVINSFERLIDFSFCQEALKKMRKIFPAIIFVLFFSILFQAASNDGRTGSEKEPLPTCTPNLDIMKIAHRGVKLYAPENTLPAAERAIEMGYDYVEVDVHYARDGVPIVFHDPILERTTNGVGPVRLYKLKALKKLDAGAWFSRDFRGTEIPTFEEMLNLMQGKISLYLDQKQNPTPEMIQLIKEYGFYENMVIVGGDFAEDFLKYDPGAPVMPGLESADEVEDILERFPSARAFNTSCKTLTRKMVEESHRRGILVFTNVLRIDPSYERECMRRTIELGADAIQFDSPDVLFPLLEEMKMELAKKITPPPDKPGPDPKIHRLCQEAVNPDAAPDKVFIHCEMESGEFAKGLQPSGGQPRKEILVVAYNLERGMFLDQQVAILKAHPEFKSPDILLISEADRGCSRTDFRNVAREMASALGMNYVYGVEFMEIPRRTKKDVNENKTLCEHGNAILSRYPILNPRVIRHRQARNWYIPPGPGRENHEPRLGGRVAIAADVKVGEDLIRAYSVHFDSGANQEDSKNRISQAEELVEQAGEITDRPVVIGGDFNTISYTAEVLLEGKNNRAVHAILDAGFQDAHASLHPLKRGTTGREYGVRGIIDLVFMRGAHVEESGICRPRACGQFSDHLPVWTRIRIE
jgi:glycerophosphoryl diester phosphodiesterase